jgi:type IV pilus assembly protein PilV
MKTAAMRFVGRPAQEGVMLIEALLGLLIFSIGILAMIGMQTMAMRATIDSKYRSEASFLANEIIGIMWGDTNDLAGYATSSACTKAACADWLTKVGTTLPDATGANAPTIVVATRQVTVTVLWKRPGEPAGTPNSQHEVVAQIFRATD